MAVKRFTNRRFIPTMQSARTVPRRRRNGLGADSRRGLCYGSRNLKAWFMSKYVALFPLEYDMSIYTILGLLACLIIAAVILTMGR